MKKKLTDAEKQAKRDGDEVRHWLAEVDAACKREKEYRKEGYRVYDLYTGRKPNPFAILYSNTDTVLPAVYSAVPRPVVQRRFKDEDPIGKYASQAGQRGLEFLIDTNVEGYETFDSAVRASVLDGLLPGRGVTSIKYESEVQEVIPDGAAEGTEPIPVKNWETVCTDSVSWDRFIHGYARKWSKVPWIAYELHLDRDEAERLGIAPDILAKIKFVEGEEESEIEKEGEGDHSGRVAGDEADAKLGEKKTALFWQIWDKDGGRKIRYLCPQYKDSLVKVEDDPLGITGFFNCPRPIQFVEKSNDLLPVALYSLYEQQAKELNDITVRITRITNAIKARALYDTELGDDMKNLLEADEPQMVPADKSSSLAAEKGLDNAVWFWPVDKLIVVLRELYAARQQCKAVIYEITGISDILRGATVASETATAQEIKNQWGTLRLKRLQKEVQRYTRDLLRMILEVAAKKFSERTWAQMTGLPFITSEKRAQAQMIAKASVASGQQPDPATLAALQAPVWEQVLSTLRNDTQRAYRIDIETNSTVEPEATEDQKMIAEVMNALAQYLNGITPLVISGAMPFEAAQSMLLAIVRRFRFGPELEEYVKAMKPPKPQDDGKKEAEAIKSKAEQERMAFEQQVAREDRAAEQQEMAQKAQLEAMKMQAEMERIELERQMAREEHAMKMAELRAKAEYNALMVEIKTKQAKERAAQPRKEAASANA